MSAIVRLKDICDVDFAPGRSLYPVGIEGVGRFFAAHEVEQMQIGMRSGLLFSRRTFFIGVGATVALLLTPKFARAANRTAWTAGNGVGLTWTNAISTGGVATLANTNSILDGTDQTNGTALDILCDLSHSITISSSTVAPGASIPYWLYYLNQDGTTYGDNHLSTTSAAVTPSAAAVAAIACFAAASQTSIIGNATGMTLAPGTFRWATQNGCGFNYTAATIKYRTYNVNLNN